eukprot:gene3569-2520_t
MILARNPNTADPHACRIRVTYHVPYAHCKNHIAALTSRTPLANNLNKAIQKLSAKVLSITNTNPHSKQQLSDYIILETHLTMQTIASKNQIHKLQPSPNHTRPLMLNDNIPKYSVNQRMPYPLPIIKSDIAQCKTTSAPASSTCNTNYNTTKTT